MRIHRLTISNFRGIKDLDWVIRDRVTCLVGCGDSTKTTILDAIDLVLSPRWNVPFVDADFHNCDYGQEILVRAIVGDVPAELMWEEKFGLLHLGWDAAAGCEREIEDGLEAALAIELRVSGDLEPSWTVAPLDARECRHISSRDREAFGVARLGEFVDRHTTWSRGSSLAKMGDGTRTIRDVLAEAQRSAMLAVRSLGETPLHASAKEVERLARELGVSPKGAYLPGLDSRSFGDGSTSLSLHDGDVPVRMSGLGSRRLLAAAIQKAVLKGQGAILVDEVEHGLEPHRIVHLVRTLTREGGDAPQVFMTTHSPTVVAELGAAMISVVQCDGGATTVTNVPADDDFAGLVRASPGALLGRKVIVCEGPTEGGVCWALDSGMPPDRGSFGLEGVVVANGEGNTKGPAMAIKLAQLGFSVAFFGDSDEAPNPGVTDMEAAGVKVLLWAGAMSTEGRVMSDLPVPALQQALELAGEEKGVESVRDQVRGRLPTGAPQFDMDVAAWIAASGDESALRAALGAAANKGKWFKNWRDGRRLGEIALAALVGSGSPTAATLSELAGWAVPEVAHGGA